MMRIRWSAWRQLTSANKNAVVEEAAATLAKMEANAGGQSALFSLLGHKGDLMLIHFRRSFDDLNQAELQLAQLALNDYLEPTTSYLPVIELGLYDSPSRLQRFEDHGIVSFEEWKRESLDVLARQKKRCIRVCLQSLPSTAMFPSIRWIDAGRGRNCTPRPLKNERVR
jgi:chlorite dismutase